jgi:predicted GH43/DUF377 family glycosyl hydrolase
MLNLTQRGAEAGREDPRWFRHKGQLWLWYTGVTGNRRRTVTNVCTARVDEKTLEVQEKYLPHYPHRRDWEKNHSMWDFNGMLFASYSVSPHRVLRIDGNQTRSYETKWDSSRWSGGEMRGGASPVRVGDEYFHFIHGLIEPNRRRRYCMGLVCYEARPPFKVTRYTPDPLEWADLERKHDNYCDVFWPAGAVLKNGEWIIAAGLHDRWCEIRTYNAKEVERRLVPVK